MYCAVRTVVALLVVLVVAAAVSKVSSTLTVKESLVYVVIEGLKNVKLVDVVGMEGSTRALRGAIVKDDKDQKQYIGITKANLQDVTYKDLQELVSKKIESQKNKESISESRFIEANIVVEGNFVGKHVKGVRNIFWDPVNSNFKVLIEFGWLEWKNSMDPQLYKFNFLDFEFSDHIVGTVTWTPRIFHIQTEDLPEGAEEEILRRSKDLGRIYAVGPLEKNTKNSFSPDLWVMVFEPTYLKTKDGTLQFPFGGMQYCKEHYVVQPGFGHTLDINRVPVGVLTTESTTAQREIVIRGAYNYVKEATEIWRTLAPSSEAFTVHYLRYKGCDITLGGILSLFESFYSDKSNQSSFKLTYVSTPVDLDNIKAKLLAAVGEGKQLQISNSLTDGEQFDEVPPHELKWLGLSEVQQNSIQVDKTAIPPSIDLQFLHLFDAEDI